MKCLFSAHRNRRPPQSKTRVEEGGQEQQEATAVPAQFVWPATRSGVQSNSHHSANGQGALGDSERPGNRSGLDGQRHKFAVPAVRHGTC